MAIDPLSVRANSTAHPHLDRTLTVRLRLVLEALAQAVSVRADSPAAQVVFPAVLPVLLAVRAVQVE